FFVIRVALFLSSQCVTLGSNFLCKITIFANRYKMRSQCHALGSSLYYLVEIKSSGSK
ncbi:hypothetical protein H9I48_02180, partial [Wolbachia pipientis]|nr:hypothetical protein [Wolbachia pipientis]